MSQVRDKMTKNAGWSASELEICGWDRFRHQYLIQNRAGELFWGRVVEVAINLEETLSRAYGNFEEQNKVFETSMIITNYCITIINSYNNNIFNYKWAVTRWQWLLCMYVNMK